jgi:hypothetical protein
MLGDFQADGVDEIIQRLHDGIVSAIESRDLFFGNARVRSKGMQNAGRQRSIDFFIELTAWA